MSATIEADIMSAPSRDTVLGEEQLAELLSRAGGRKISVDKLRKQDYPGFFVGRDRFYIYGQVLDCMAERARGEARAKGK